MAEYFIIIQQQTILDPRLIKKTLNWHKKVKISSKNIKILLQVQNQVGILVVDGLNLQIVLNLSVLQM